METRKIYKCFISSPGDCQNERESCQEVIDHINIGLAKHLGINFETFMWEYDVLPDMGRNGQEIIDEYISKSEYDIFIGIMKNRFGQPTKKAGCGTEHEFNDALERKKNGDKSLPQILFFFGKEMIDPDNFDSDQIQKVKEFKKRIGGDGLYCVFNGIQNFESLLNDKLELFIQEHSPLDSPGEKVKQVDIVLKRLEGDLNESLKTYNEKSPVWIDPIISSKRDVPVDPSRNDEHRIDLKSIIETPNNIIIKAPSEFGLTSLAHYLKLEAWKVGKTFLYIDSKVTKKHKIVKDIHNAAETYFFKKAEQVDAILLDSLCLEEIGAMQMVKNICDGFPKTPLIIFNTLENSFFLKSNDDDKVEIKRDFISYYLLPLRQTEVRKLVASYTNLKSLDEDSDVILSRITKDLVNLNMHRTAKNCICILRASSKIGSQYSPVNRTKLLETILNTIFEEYEIPTYKDKKPDVKDCSFVLGYLCEVLVAKGEFEFSTDYFKAKLGEFCKANYIELDLQYLLTVLIDNSIFGQRNSDTIYFKNSYWVFYFIAQRMILDKKFLMKIYEEKKYIDYPEIMEFYTGIDRNREDAIQILNDDLGQTLLTVRGKVNIPDTLNPFKSISWSPDLAALEKEEAKIGENVITSGLPDEVKDRYADKHYNQLKPYNQVINSVIRDYLYLVLWRQISAASRALRNSDFVDSGLEKSGLKKGLLNKILEAWNEINKLLIVLSPLLADKGKAAFEGASFYLDDSFNPTDPAKKRLAVLLAVPANVVRYFKDDLFSNKMGPLLFDQAERETNSLLKHELMLLIVTERPKGWNRIIDNYIIAQNKNSFFLSDLLTTLKHTKDYEAIELEEKRILDMLATKCRAKHLFNSNNPDPGLINRMRKLDEGKKF